jgi:hypothetical protein
MLYCKEIRNQPDQVSKYEKYQKDPQMVAGSLLPLETWKGEGSCLLTRLTLRRSHFRVVDKRGEASSFASGQADRQIGRYRTQEVYSVQYLSDYS